MLALLAVAALQSPTWEALKIEPLASERELPGSAHGVFFVNDRTGWVVGTGIILRTEDGGANWRVQYRSQGLRVAQEKEDFWQIWFQDRDNGWVVGGQPWGCMGPQGDAVMWRTRDGGTTWEPVKSMADKGWYYQIRFVDSKTGWVNGSFLGRTGVWKTADGGETWQAAMDHREGAVEFVSATVTYALDRDGVLKTDNGGKSWRRSESPVDPYWGPTCFCFVDADTGWIAVNSNADVYLLHTGDGGKTWERRGADHLRGVDHPVDIRFVSRTEGWLLVRDHRWSRIYRSEDGGRTWSRETMAEGSFGELCFTAKGDMFSVGGSTLLRRKH